MLVATILHDPTLAVYERFVKQTFTSPYADDFVVIVSHETPLEPYKLILGDKIHIQSGRGVAGARREALQYFLTTANSYILVADFDRLLYWLAHDPKSFHGIYQNVLDECVFIGRSERAMMSHPQPQRSTERAINTYTFAALCPGQTVHDITAGTYIMDRHVAHHIASNSYAVDSGAVDVEWFALASLRYGELKYLEVDGLGFEGAWAGSEPEVVPAVEHKRQLNLDRAIATVDMIKFWGGDR